MAADSKHAQAHKVLQQFELVKKNHIIAFFLCLIFGFWGAHRYYLGQKSLALRLALIWGILLLLTLIAGFWDKFLLALLWGYWDIYDVLNELMVIIGAFSQVGADTFNEDSMFALNLKHVVPDTLRVLFGLFVVWELFRIVGLTDRRNEEIKKQLKANISQD